MDEELSGIAALAGNFRDRELRTRWEELDAPSGEMLGALLGRVAALGFFSLAFDDGAGGGISACAAFIGEISRGCPALAAALASHVAAAAPTALSRGTRGADEVIAGVRAREASGEPALMTPAWMEEDVFAGGGLAAGRMETALRESGDGFSLSGRKLFVPAAEQAAYIVVAASLDGGGTAWAVVPGGAPGVTAERAREMMGLRLCPFSDVEFDGVKVPRGWVFAGGALDDPALVFSRSDACLGAVALGMAEEALDAALKYSVSRYQGGGMICDHDAVREMLAGTALGIEASGALAAAGAKTTAEPRTGGSTAVLGAVAAADAAVRAALDAVQTLGGYGYMRDYRVERILRDAKTFQNTVVLPRARTMEHVRRLIQKMR
ncbi:MAG: acyl-CoA dehydrogenase family protein [bacterium]